MEETYDRNGDFKRMIDKMLMSKAYVEVLEILKHVPLEDYNRIPYEIIENMQLNMDKTYKYEVTKSDDFQEQEMLKETETILAVLFRDYWATEEQRRKILEKERQDLNILEEGKREKYNPEDIFKKINKENNINIKTAESNTNTALTEYKESFFAKLKNFLLKILHINKK